MSSRFDHYRGKAEECVRAAESATDPETKRHYLELAGQWRELAEQVELADRHKPR